MTDGLALVPSQTQRGKAKNLADQVTEQVGQIILGKDREIRLAFACLLARGH
jgi:MoxR-like ATPase